MAAKISDLPEALPSLLSWLTSQMMGRRKVGGDMAEDAKVPPPEIWQVFCD
jgi:hypothetical protein